MAIPFSFLVTWAKVHRAEDSSLTYVRTLDQKRSFQTVEEILSSGESGKKIADLRACLISRFNDIQADFMASLNSPSAISARSDTVLGDSPVTDAFVDRLKAFIKDYWEVRLASAPDIKQIVFGESFVPKPFHVDVPSDENLSSQFNVTAQSIKNHRDKCTDECLALLMEGKSVDSYRAESSLVRDMNALKERFGVGISYETACRITGIRDDRTFYFILKLFDLALTKRSDVKIRAVLPNRTIGSYSNNLGKVLDFFREETVCIRYDEDIVPALKRITKDRNLSESFKSIILHSDEFVHYSAKGQDYIALRWDLLQFLPSRVCWIVFQQGAFDLKSAVSSDRIVTLYNSGDYAGQYKEERITRDQIRATHLKGCWRLMNIGKQEYWMIRNSKRDSFDLGQYVGSLLTAGMTYDQFIRKAKDVGLLPIYSEATLIPYYQKFAVGNVSGPRERIDWSACLDDTESLLKAKNKPMKSREIMDFLIQKNQLSTSLRSFSVTFLKKLKDSSRFITESCSSPKEGVWVALPGMVIPKSYREEIREKAIDLLRKAPDRTMDMRLLNQLFEPMVPNNLVKASALQSIFNDEKYFIKIGKGKDSTIMLNPLL